MMDRGWEGRRQLENNIKGRQLEYRQFRRLDGADLRQMMLVNTQFNLFFFRVQGASDNVKHLTHIMSSELKPYLFSVTDSSHARSLGASGVCGKHARLDRRPESAEFQFYPPTET